MSTIGEFFGVANVSGTIVAASTSVVNILPDESGRRKFTIFNHGPASLHVKLDADATLNDFSVKITSASLYESTNPQFTGSVTGIWDTANGLAMVTSYNKQ